MAPLRVRFILCQGRVLRLEKAITRLLVAHDASEMGNYQEALERLRDLMAED